MPWINGKFVPDIPAPPPPRAPGASTLPTNNNRTAGARLLLLPPRCRAPPLQPIGVAVVGRIRTSAGQTPQTLLHRIRVDSLLPT